MNVLSFWKPDDTLKIIDVFVDNPINFNELSRDMIIKKAAGIEVPIPSLKHLIRMKRLSGRPEDLRDIEMLEKLNEKKEK